ncbi:helix-turn-helix domain-containing protein [Curtobacterium flaccumfaciens]|uniref:helix-turn-helix domain-containing protein n=1 Tax=Curtobacterium flaccumfaciens TaxID=2035 RepID=UPI0021FACC67|nr:helix-turn-helix domain-containing protein [Curtobacterium flaccumfaciens]UWD83606.1 helix-turn-helix domain-containing protein [Curtobacterium flaccumfaciens]
MSAQKITALAEPDVTRKELALALGISLDTVHRLTHSGDIPYLRRGRLYRYNVAEVREALRPQTVDSWARPSRKKLRA